MKKLALCALLTMSVTISSPAAELNVSVTDFGAVSDTTQLSSQAFQNAIDHCASRGGGVVNVPAGKYLCASVWLKSGVTLNLESGATVFASRNVAHYTTTMQRGANDMPEAHVLIGALNAHNIAITGDGTLNCRAERETYQRKPFTVLNDSITGREVQNAHNYGVDYLTKWRKIPPFTSAIFFVDCKNVTLHNCNVVDANGWSVHLQWCENVDVNNVQIVSNLHNGVNSDGLDIDGCRDVCVKNCFISTGDDALCLKTTKCGDRSQSCERVTISDCMLQSSSSALKIGTESHSDFSQITATNCCIFGSNRGISMMIRDGGNVSNVSFSNITIQCERKETFWWGNGDPIWLIVYRRKEADRAGSIKNVTFNNINAVGMSGNRFEAFDGQIENLVFDNVRMMIVPETAVDKRCKHMWSFENVSNVRFANITSKWHQLSPDPTWQQTIHLKNTTNFSQE